MSQSEKLSVQINSSNVKQRSILINEAENFTNFILRQVMQAQGKQKIVISYTPEDLVQLAVTIHQLIQVAKDTGKN